jgi:hypothetical protein
LTDNKNFPNPTPALNDVTAAVDGREQASARVRSARAQVTTRTATQDNAQSKLDQVLTQLASYVESVAGKDDTLITSVGMETKASPSTPTLPSVPQALTAAIGDHDGELFLSWKPVPNARSHVIESSTDPATLRFGSMGHRDVCDKDDQRFEESDALLVSRSRGRRGWSKRME